VALEAALAHASGESRPGERCAPAARRLPGPLLDGDESAWVASRATRCVALRAGADGTGRALERAGDWTTAIDVYRRGLEADNLAESFYRGLMRALARTGTMRRR
jgi:two-component SAPR family response regulator